METVEEKDIVLVDKLKQNLIVIYKRIGDRVALLTKGNSYTGNELAKEVEDETEFGVKLITNLVHLTIDLLSRQKLDFE